MLRTIMFRLTAEEALALQQQYLCCTRDEYAIIKASGGGILDYLQGQITQDIHQLTEKHGIYTAILTPQGKAVSDLYIICGHNRELIIIARQNDAAPLVGRIRQFSLGYELRVGIVDSLKLISLQGCGCDVFLQAANLPVPGTNRLATASMHGRELFTVRMPEAADDGVWLVTDDAESLINHSESIVDEQVIHTARVIKGIPAFGIDWDRQVLPLNANLIEMDGVNFDKGCYVGQEVTSRMQWRGGVRKRLYRVQLESFPETLPCPVSTTVEIGMVTSAAVDASGKVFGIAHLPIEMVEKQTSLIDPEGDSIQVIEVCHA